MFARRDYSLPLHLRGNPIPGRRNTLTLKGLKVLKLSAFSLYKATIEVVEKLALTSGAEDISDPYAAVLSSSKSNLPLTMVWKFWGKSSAWSSASQISAQILGRVEASHKRTPEQHTQHLNCYKHRAVAMRRPAG